MAAVRLMVVKLVWGSSGLTLELSDREADSSIKPAANPGSLQRVLGHHYDN
jgi:hypothetical protein